MAKRARPATPPAGVPPRWQLLKSRLEGICPSGTDTLQQLWRWRSVPKEQQPFLLQASGYDRQGMLHSLSHALWESDTTVGAGAGPPRRAWRWECSARARLPATLAPLAATPLAMSCAAAAQVFKAHITTSPSGKVSDMFWIYDNRNELPENHRWGGG